jgi:aryl-alcohol dehydrogenase-like predicted oxidoreductase
MSLLAKPDKKSKMRYNQLGNTGLRVSEICLGAMTFTLDGKNEW